MSPRRPPAPVEIPVDPVIEACKAGAEVTLLEEDLRLTPEERLAKLEAWLNSAERIRGPAAPRRRT